MLLGIENFEHSRDAHETSWGAFLIIPVFVILFVVVILGSIVILSN